MTIQWLMMATHVPPGGALGGMVRYTVELVQALDARPDVTVSVLVDSSASDYWGELLGDPGRVFPLVNAPAPAQAFLERQGRGSPAFDRPFDVIQGTKHIVPRRTAAKRRVMTVHDLLPLDRPGDFGPIKRALLPGPYLASARDSDVLLCISQATRDRLLSYVPSVRERTRLVPLANESQGLADAVPRPIDELAGRPFALVVGDSSPRKNLPLVVDNWPQVRRQVPDAQLAVVGPPAWSRSEVGEELDAGVRVLGRVDDDQLRWAYANAHVVLCPSLLEGFGLPSVEGLRAGTPVITSEDPALCEASGDAAVHVSSLSADQWVDAMADALRTRGQARVPEERTWAEVADETVRAVMS